jgi:hypothetical protein
MCSLTRVTLFPVTLVALWMVWCYVPSSKVCWALLQLLQSQHLV